MVDLDNDQNDNLLDDTEEATIGMSEIDAFDFERAAMLMGIMEKVANIGVKSTAIGGLAAAALNEMNEEAKAITKRRADEFAKAEAKAREDAAREAREQAARNAETTLEPYQEPAPRAIPSASVAPRINTGAAPERRL